MANRPVGIPAVLRVVAIGVADIDLLEFVDQAGSFWGQ
jgi:hypothetical protein